MHRPHWHCLTGLGHARVGCRDTDCDRRCWATTPPAPANDQAPQLYWRRRPRRRQVHSSWLVRWRLRVSILEHSGPRLHFPMQLRCLLETQAAAKMPGCRILLARSARPRTATPVCVPLVLSVRVYSCPATSTVKVLGRIAGLGRGFSAVAAGRGPVSAVTRYTLPVAGSRVMVRAPRCVERLCSTL